MDTSYAPPARQQQQPGPLGGGGQASGDESPAGGEAPAGTPPRAGLGKRDLDRTPGGGPAAGREQATATAPRKSAREVFAESPNRVDNEYPNLFEVLRLRAAGEAEGLIDADCARKTDYNNPATAAFIGEYIDAAPSKLPRPLMPGGARGVGEDSSGQPVLDTGEVLVLWAREFNVRYARKLVKVVKGKATIDNLQATRALALLGWGTPQRHASSLQLVPPLALTGGPKREGSTVPERWRGSGSNPYPVSLLPDCTDGEQVWDLENPLHRALAVEIHNVANTDEAFLEAGAGGDTLIHSGDRWDANRIEGNLELSEDVLMRLLQAYGSNVLLGVVLLRQANAWSSVPVLLALHDALSRGAHAAPHKDKASRVSPMMSCGSRRDIVHMRVLAAAVRPTTAAGAAPLPLTAANYQSFSICPMETSDKVLYAQSLGLRDLVEFLATLTPQEAFLVSAKFHKGQSLSISALRARLLEVYKRAQVELGADAAASTYGVSGTLVRARARVPRGSPCLVGQSRA